MDFQKMGSFLFLDETNLATGNTARLYQSNYSNQFEQLYDYDPKKKNLRVRIESKTDYPNYFKRSLEKKKGWNN